MIIWQWPTFEQKFGEQIPGSDIGLLFKANTKFKIVRSDISKKKYNILPYSHDDPINPETQEHSNLLWYIKQVPPFKQVFSDDLHKYLIRDEILNGLKS